ncbi:3-keto-5-aminohexanoate cleavage protein [Rhodoplanes sp. SY1]|uniref:3-keto-5-aminohexanoate cleavage protein n=1 Tax=Rhodoplanes sp. SY1 TaxID=3166646 RepID=UPI0038B41AA3
MSASSAASGATTPKSTAPKNKVIISCAITGAIHTPSMSPHLPVTPDEIAQSAIGAAKAGAAIVHLHARNPETGRPDQSPEAFAKFLPTIKAGCDAIVNITTGGAPTMLVSERVRPAAVHSPELASLNMGSFNFALYPMLNRFKTFKHDWEAAYLEGTRDLIFRNTFKDIEFVLATCRDNGTRFEFECYDIGHLYNLAHFLERGLVQPPLFVQSVFGILGGMGTHPEDIAMMRRTADRLLGRDTYRWSVLGAGRAQMPTAAIAAAQGGNVRVGLEDSLWIGPGQLAESNAQQVTKVRQIVEGLGLEIATPDEARQILALKGGDKVGF